MIRSHGFVAESPTSKLSPYSFERRDPGPHDIVVDIAYSGICHSDIHQVRDEWGGSIYPMVPGHEIVGHVSKVGSAVKKFKEGDPAGVGVMVDSCRVCEHCKAQLQQYCVKGMVPTYNARDYNGEITFGGYSNNIVVDEGYAFTLSPKLDLAATAPLLCAGITTYSPLRHWKVSKGMKIGIVGLGGLGHMALKFAHSFGAHVVQFTTSTNKVEDAKRLGADEVVISKDADAMAKQHGTFDFVLDTVSGSHDINAFLELLKLDATLCNVGLPEEPTQLKGFAIFKNRRSFAASMIGGMQETQEMLDYCADHGIVSDIELTSITKLEDAYKRVIKGDVKYRFVIDMGTLDRN